jgi:hypothetical protein
MPTPTPGEGLDRASHCLVACAAQPWPVLVPLACWFDGVGLWMTAASASPLVNALRGDPRCLVSIPGVGEASGVVADGVARVYGTFDPVGLALHSPMVIAALGALTLRNAGAVAGYLQDLPLVPTGRLPRGRVAIRVVLSATRAAPAPAAPRSGVAPALPTVIPPDVRRGVSGRRLVELATQHDSGERSTLTLGPAVWSGGFALAAPAGRPLLAGMAATVTVHRGAEGRPSAALGLSLSGAIAPGGRLQVAQASWWHGWERGDAEIVETPSAVVLPE